MTDDNEPTLEEIEEYFDLAFGAVADNAFENQLDVLLPEGFVEKTTQELYDRFNESISQPAPGSGDGRHPLMQTAEVELPTVEEMFKPPLSPAIGRQQKRYEAIAKRAREVEPMDRVWFSMDSLPDVQFMIDRVEYEVVAVAPNDSGSEVSIELRQIGTQNTSGYND